MLCCVCGGEVRVQNNAKLRFNVNGELHLVLLILLNNHENLMTFQIVSSVHIWRQG